MTSPGMFTRSRDLNPDNTNTLMQVHLRITIPQGLCRSLRWSATPLRLIRHIHSRCLRQPIKRPLTNRQIAIVLPRSHLTNSSNRPTGDLVRMVHPRPLLRTATVTPRSMIHRDTDL